MKKIKQSFVVHINHGYPNYRWWIKLPTNGCYGIPFYLVYNRRTNED
ncbi:hypothetical protein [Streptococcus agalactiae]